MYIISKLYGNKLLTVSRSKGAPPKVSESWIVAPVLLTTKNTLSGLTASPSISKLTKGLKSELSEDVASLILTVVSFGMLTEIVSVVVLISLLSSLEILATPIVF